MYKRMDFFSLHLMALLITFSHKVRGFEHGKVDRKYLSSCTDIGYRLQNCTQSPNYGLVDNMPIVMNATEIKLFCLDKDATLECIEHIVTACTDTLTGISAIIYDLKTFETTYNTLCGNMELTWWSETSCILQLDTKLHDCRRMKERILAEVQRTGLSDIYCEWVMHGLNSLPNDTILDTSKMTAFADDELSVAEKMKYLFHAFRRLDDLYSCNTFHTDPLCKQQYSDYLTRFYRMMLTPSFCDVQLTNDEGVYRRVTADILSSTDASASNAFALTVSSFSMVLCVMLIVAVAR